ncbi:MAG: Ig-like domain-containing protein [Bacilli bacterium]|nr:Ig-like domain-containing protein [Bacilli bacterium]MDD4387617.1 Ig-like domain-containing protein [Bacilli bacterium]
MRRNAFFLILIICVFGLVLFGCKKEPNGDNNGKKPTLSVTTNIFELEEGKTETIVPNISGTTKELEILFSSENPEIATVDKDGVISAISQGETTIIVSLKDYPDITVTVTILVAEGVPEEPLTLVGPDTVYASQTIQLTANDYYSEDNTVIWESKTPTILKVDQNGVVTGLQEGEGIVRITSWVTAEWIEKEITVLTPDPESVEIGDISYQRITFSTTIRLVAKVMPNGAKQEIAWTSSDDDICTIDQNGKIKPLKPGEVTMKATVKNTDISGEITLKIEPTLMELLEHYNNENLLVQDIKVFGYEAMFQPKGYYEHKLIGSVNKYLSADLVITESILSKTLQNRPGNIQTETKYITVHDTGSAGPSAGAAAHNSYIHSGPEASWHYTVGNDGIYHHIPDNEIAWHAGDGTGTPYESFDSGIPYTDKKKPVVTITADGYYALDGTKSNVAVPRKPDNLIPNTSEINDMGIEVTKGTNGNWYIGKSWWSKSYGKIGNRGGNLNSIGIESCVDQGSDVFLTWQLLAKLVAKLLEDTGLGLEHVVQHHYFSGKDCPMTMRHSNNFEMFLGMVEAEYTIRTMFKDYTIQFYSNNPSYIDNRGRIIDLPLTPTRASYTVEITNKNTEKTETKLFYVNLPAK